MSDSADQSFECPACGKAYRWQDRLAGKKVRCKCGVALKLPAWLPGDVRVVEEEDYSPITGDDDAEAPSERDSGTKASTRRPDDAGGYDVERSDEQASGKADADTPRFARENKARCPSCGSAMKPHAVICLNCGHNRSTGEKIKTERIEGDAAAAQDDAAATDADAPSSRGEAIKPIYDHSNPTFTNIILPIGLILLGVVVAIAEQRYWTDDPAESLVGALLVVGVTLAVSIPITLLGVMIAAPVLGLSFGYLGHALLKLAAIIVGPSAIGEIAMYLLGGDLFGWFIGLFVTLGFYRGLMQALFDLDSDDAIKCIIIIAVVRYAVSIAISLTLIALIIR